MTDSNPPERRRGHVELSDKLQTLELQIVQGFSELKVHHTGIQAAIKQLGKGQQRLSEALYGNGKEGLITTVAKIMQRQNVMWGILATIGAAHITFLTTLIIQQFI